MHSVAGKFQKGLGHEGGRQPVRAGAAQHDAAQHDDVVRRLQRIGAVLQIDLELAGRSFLDDRVDRQALRVRRVADHVEEVGMFGQIVEPVHAQPVRPGGGADGTGHPVGPFGLRIEQIEFQFESDHGEEAPGVDLGDLPLQDLPRVGHVGLALRGEGLEQHLRGLALGPGHDGERSARRTAIAVLIAGLDVQPRLDHLATPHVETVQRHGEIDAFLESLLQRIARRPFAAHDAVRIDQQELDGLDVGMFLDEGAVFALVIRGDEFGR